MALGNLLRLIRWPGAVTAAANALTGFLVAHELTSRAEAGSALGAAVGGAIVYAGGVVLNDVADAERDAVLHPARPIPAGLVTRASAKAFGLALLIAGAAVTAILAGPWAGAASGLAGLFALAYDFSAKRFRVPGALTLALARGANALSGALAGALAGAASLEVLDATTHPLVLVYLAAIVTYTALLTFASTFEERRPTPFAAAAFATVLFVAAALPWSAFHASWRTAPALALVPLAITLVIAAREAAEPDGPGLGAVIRAGVFGFLLVDSAWLFGVGRYDTGFGLLLGYVALRLVLSRARS